MRFECSIALLVACGLGAGACVGDAEPESVQVVAHHGERVELPSPKESAYLEDSVIELVVVEVPQGVERDDILEGSGAPVLVASSRGRYVLDRWLVVGASSHWTTRYFVDVVNAPPTAIITGPEEALLGDTVSLDGSSSTDSETTTLSYSWRMASRPRDSVVELADAGAEQTSFSPDRPGLYTVELCVFDGEDWCLEDATSRVLVR